MAAETGCTIDHHITNPVYLCMLFWAMALGYRRNLIGATKLVSGWSITVAPENQGNVM